MADSPFKDCFHGGMWMHGSLEENDYHRIHAPVGGKVVEARVISGHYHTLMKTIDLETEANGSIDSSLNGQRKTLRKRRVFRTPNEPGY